MSEARPRRLLLAYHFFHPDEVVSARMFSDLARAQQERGWEVTALTSNRASGDAPGRYAPRERWEGVRVERSFRPPWPQRRPLARLLNSAWLLAAWRRRARRLGPFEAVVAGTDPAFGPLLLPPLRRAWPRARLATWCFDLYPEAIEADGVGGALRALLPLPRAAMARAYRACDALVDLGPRMRERLLAYDSPARRLTITPWALQEEPAAPGPPAARGEALVPGARLVALYSGNLGRAHHAQPLLELARACRARSGTALGFAFACAGHARAELERALAPEDVNVRLLPLVPEASLPERLAAADLHLVSLRPAWQGVVVPSKFFAALALGRPVLYAGPAASDVASWVREHDLGLVLDAGTEAAVVEALHGLERGRGRLRDWGENARRVYAARFSRAAGLSAWAALLDGP